MRSLAIKVFVYFLISTLFKVRLFTIYTSRMRPGDTFLQTLFKGLSDTIVLILLYVLFMAFSVFMYTCHSVCMFVGDFLVTVIIGFLFISVCAHTEHA